MDSPLPLDPLALPFSRLPVRWTGSRGTPYTRWVPYGMPHLADYKGVLDAVFFLYRSVEDAAQGTGFVGTGFFVGVPSRRWGDRHLHVHGVSNWHVVCTKSGPVIRINRVDGGRPEALDLEPHEWVWRPHWHDLAVSPPLALNFAAHRARVLHRNLLLTEAEERDRDINVADDVFMIGRFVDYVGAETNEPAARFGHVSMIGARVRQETHYYGRSIVLDMHSKGGFSGSPVFVYRTAGSHLSTSEAVMMNWHYLKLLGVHWGQFPDFMEMDHRPPSDKTVGSMAALTEGASKAYVIGLSGMTCVVPAAALLDLLDDPRLVEMREHVERQIEPEMAKRGSPPIPESA